MTRTRRINGCNVVFQHYPAYGWVAEFYGRREDRNCITGQTFHGVFYACRLADLRRTVHELTARP